MTVEDFGLAVAAACGAGATLYCVGYGAAWVWNLFKSMGRSFLDW